jgi:hypothetical protein
LVLPDGLPVLPLPVPLVPLPVVVPCASKTGRAAGAVVGAAGAPDMARTKSVVVIMDSS